MSKKIIGVAAIVMFLIFTPIAVLATDTKEDAIQIIKTEEEKYIVYVKDLQKEEFNYAISNTPTVKEMDLKYIHSAKDDEQNQVIVIDKSVYNVKQNPVAYLWIKQGKNSIISGKEIDFSQSFEKSKIEEVENTGKRIKTEIISDLVQEDRTDENGVKITVKVGGIKIKDNQNARYFYEIMPATDEYGTLMELAEKIKSWLNVLPEDQRPAVMKRYATLYSSSSQTANLLPLWLDITPEKNVKDVLETLVQDLEVTRAWHINTGVVGLKFMFDVLIKYGYEDLAYRLITQTSFPSFGYQIEKEGATTLWERWEFLNNDKCFNSHSHPFAGSVDVYFYKILAGLGLDEEVSGFKKIILKPIMSGDLPYASASVNTIRGKVVSAWERNDEELRYKVEVPGNTTAELYIPKNAWDKIEITEGTKSCWNGENAVDVEGMTYLREEEKYVVYQIEAGSYEFKVAPVK